jgi:tetratricopeptide (TPR) repeat protein
MARLDRLSTAKEVAQRAAVLGREFGYPLLAAVAEMEEAGLRQGLARLVDAEIVFQRGEPPESTYTFKHALVQEAAYESLLKRTRQQLHGRVVDVLCERFRERVESEPELVARHAEAAGRSDDAITYYGRAGEQAQARSAPEEAIGHLRGAIALLATRPEGRERDSREGVLQLALVGSLRPARGFSHPDVEATYERARIVCENAGDARQLGLALGALASFYSNRGEVERGGALAARVLMAAEQSGDSEIAVAANLELANAEFWQGKFASVLARAETVRGLYEAQRHHTLVSTFGQDPGVSARCYSALSFWNLGWPNRALGRAREAVELAHQLADHPFSLAFALGFETILYTQLRDTTTKRQRAEELIALSEGQGFPLWLGLGRAWHAAARVMAGETGALVDLLAALASVAETGNQAGAPGMFAELADTYMAAEQLDEARGAVETGLAISAQTGQRFSDAELHRLEGEILRKTVDAQQSSVGSQQAPEACFHRALAIAREQGARSVELRISTSLACMWRDQGKRADARGLLAPIYGWFTEGFDTRDLIEGKALLDELR